MKFKRIISTGLSAAIAVSCISIPAAADTQNHSLGIAENEDSAVSDGALEVTESTFSFGSGNTALKPGTYDINVSLKNAENTEEKASAADSIAAGRLAVDEDGRAEVELSLTYFTAETEADEEAGTVKEIEARTSSWLIYQGTKPAGETIAAEETKDEDGNVTAVVFDLPDNSFDGVYVNMRIEALEINSDAYLALDYESAEAVSEESLEVRATVSVTDGIITEISLEADTEDEEISAELEAAASALTQQLAGLTPAEALELYETEGFDESAYSLSEITEAVLSALTLAAEDNSDEDSDTGSDDNSGTGEDDNTADETESETETETESETVTEASAETTTAAATETTTKKTSSSSGSSSSSSSSKANGSSGSGSGSHAYVGTSSSNKTAEDDDEDEAEAVSYTSGYEVRVTIGSTAVVINGKTSTMEAAPYIQTESSSTLVPLRFVALAILGGSVSGADDSDIVSWDSDTRTATIYAGDDVIKFTADSNNVTINGVTSAMSYGVKAEIKDSRMYIPFRALGEALGVEVEWDSAAKTAIYKAE